VTYIPKKGDFIALDFSPQSGHEQLGRRPALVVSNQPFHKATGMAIVCPLTNTDRANPFHVPVGHRSSLTGFVMVEQAKSVDFRSRRAKFISAAPRPMLTEVEDILQACLTDS
jgi:mRNA interferase MazF